MDIETELARALRTQDPGPDFTRAVLRQLDAAELPIAQPARRPVSRWQLPVSLAASVLLVTAGAWLINRHQHQQQMVFAGEQLAMALAITSEQLQHVQQKISRNEDLEDGI